jgi:starch synthase
VPTNLKVLFVTSEIFPLIKTGGLADVSGALPLALRALGMDVRVLIPGYPAILKQLPDLKPVTLLDDLLPDIGDIRLLAATLPGSDLPLLVLDCPALYDRPGGPYLTTDGHDWPDNAVRVGLFSRVGAWLSGANTPLAWQPDVVHCNDWQSALIPALLHYSEPAHAKSVMSIHNLAFQGNFDFHWAARLQLPPESLSMAGLEFYGRLSFLKGGLMFADKITTVSQTYAAEIQTPTFGYGMEGLLQQRSADLTGIVNGIGDDWNVEHDPHVFQPYDRTTLQRKAENKRQLQLELGLQVGSFPLFCMVSRLTHHKGIDLVLDCAHELLDSGAQLAILGSGEAQYEQRLRDLAHQQPGVVSAVFGYHEALAHRLIAGGDIFLMPSRFEPCGLAQMYSMAYGTPPIVRRTGGLADTVTDTTLATLKNGRATGFVFDHADAAGFMWAAQRALVSYHSKPGWKRIQRNGMACDFGWRKAALAYLEVYRAMLPAVAETPALLTFKGEANEKEEAQA